MTLRKISELEFSSIKNSLKEFLKDQSEFSDYDFEGSGLNILLDVLAANTYYTSYYANMVNNESWLDSALTRSAIVSHAKTLGYTPKSIVASKAIINIRFNSPSGSPASITIPRNTKFTAFIDGVTYTFYTNDVYVAYADQNYLVENVILYEGKKYEYRYTVDASEVQHFIIPNDNVDTGIITVKIQNSATDLTQTVFTKNINATAIDGSSTVYFLEENREGKYELIFGDGILGKKLETGNIVIIEYAITSGEDANNVVTFTLADSISGFTNVTLTTIQKSFGGAKKESLPSIKFTAPRVFQSQQRAITTNDYEALLPTLYSNAKSYKVWGGEDHSPPTYGKVFISLQPTEGYIITNTIKDYIVNTLLKPYSIVTVIPEIVDPQYTKIHVDSIIKWNPNLTSYSESQLKQLVLNSVLYYGDTELNKFDTIFRYSAFIQKIDSTNVAIKGNLTDIKISNDITPTLNTKLKYSTEFNNKIEPGSISSTGFRFLEDSLAGVPTHFFDDDGLGKIRIYRLVSGNKVYTDMEAGTINYITGLISLDSITFIATTATAKVEIKAIPQDFDITPVRNQILLLETANVNITMQTDI